MYTLLKPKHAQPCIPRVKHTFGGSKMNHHADKIKSVLFFVDFSMRNADSSLSRRSSICSFFVVSNSVTVEIIFFLHYPGKPW